MNASRRKTLASRKTCLTFCEGPARYSLPDLFATGLTQREKGLLVHAAAYNEVI